jgi:hypothetical protein
MLRLHGRQNGSTHNLSLSQKEETFIPGDSWWTCVSPRIRCNRILDGDLLPWRVSLEGSERRAAFRRPPDVIDNAILQALDKTPFTSVREFAKSICISRATVWRRLTAFLGLFVKHLHWDRYPPDRCAVTNSSQLVKRIGETLRVCAGQWLTEFYDLGWVLVLFVDKRRKKFWFKHVSNPLKGWNIWSHSREIQGFFRRLYWTAEMDCLERRSLLSIA